MKTNRKSKRPEGFGMAVLTNRLDYSIDYDALRAHYAVFRFRTPVDNQWYSAYRLTLSLPEGYCLSTAAGRETEDMSTRTWYYILVPRQVCREIPVLLDRYGGEGLVYNEYELTPCRDNDRLVMTLLLNTLTMSGDTEARHVDMGHLLIVRGDNFMTNGRDAEKLDGGLLGLEISINGEMALTASTVTFRRLRKKQDIVLPDAPATTALMPHALQTATSEDHSAATMEKERKKVVKHHYYVLDKLSMRITRELPPDWEEQEARGNIQFYRRSASSRYTRNVVQQLTMGEETLHLNKTAVLYRLRDLMRDKYGHIVGRFGFMRIADTCLTTADYRAAATRITGRVLDGCRFRIEDTECTPLSLELHQKMAGLLPEAMKKAGVSGWSLSETAETPTLVLRIVPSLEKDNRRENKKKSKKGEKEAATEAPARTDTYRQITRAQALAAGSAYQHLTADAKYRKESTLKAAMVRMVRELAVKRMLATRHLHDESLKELCAGWSFAVCRDLGMNRYIGLVMHVEPDGSIRMSRLGHPMDMPASPARQHVNLLDVTDAQHLSARFGMDLFSQDCYYLVSSAYNSYTIRCHAVHALPDYDLVKDYYEEVRGQRVWSADGLSDLLEAEAGANYTPEVQEMVYRQEAYTVSQLRSLAHRLKGNRAVHALLSAEVEPYRHLEQMRNRDKVDSYFAGLVDIHHWTDEGGHMCYLSTENGNTLTAVKGKAYKGFPHVRSVIPCRISSPESIPADHERIIALLQTGFGIDDHGTALPFCFKPVTEMCDLLCLDRYGIHWSNMNRTNYEEWETGFFMTTLGNLK